MDIVWDTAGRALIFIMAPFAVKEIAYQVLKRLPEGELKDLLNLKLY